MESYLRQCLAKVRAEYAEIRWEEIRSVYIHYVGKELEAIRELREQGGAIRVKDKGGWSFVSFNNLDRLPHYLELAAKQAFLIKGRAIKLAPVPVVNKIFSLSLKKDPRQISLEEKYQLCTNYNRILLSSPQIQTSDLRYEDVCTLKYLVTSEGTYIKQERMDTVLGMTAIAKKGHNVQSAHEGIGGIGGFELAEDKGKEAEETKRRALELLKAQPAEKGRYTVVVDPKLSGVFAHEAFGHLSEADFLHENERMLKIMRLDRIFGNYQLNIVDDPTIRGEGGFYFYDDEGVAARKTYLIKNGKLTGRLHSRETAARMGEAPTGNARAISYQFSPIVRMSNTYIEPDQMTKEEMIAGVKKGIYAQGFRGGQTNLEMFTFAPEQGYLIENGRLVRKIRDFNLTGNIFVTFSEIDAVGNDLVLFSGPGGCGKGGQSPLPVSTGGPHIRIRNLVVGGR